MNLEPGRSNGNGAGGGGGGELCTTNAIPPTTITIPTGDATGPGVEEQPRGR